MPDDEELIQNPYWLVIEGRRDRARAHADTLRDALQDMVTAMDNNAWVSTAADTFYGELTVHVNALDTASERAMDEFSDALDTVPEKVPPDSGYVHWHQFH